MMRDVAYISGRLRIGENLEQGTVVVDQSTGLIIEVKLQKDICQGNGQATLAGDTCRVGEGQVGLVGHVDAKEDQEREAESQYPGRHFSYGSEMVIEVGDFNAHAHPEQSLYTDMVDKSWDLPTWCRNTIYKYSPRLQPEHIYLACLRAFSRMVQLGVTTVAVSFYCHNQQGNQYDKEVIRAAGDVGIRLFFGRMNYDIINQQAYEAKRTSQEFYFETPGVAEENYIALAAEIEGSRVVVAPSIHSIHASTQEAIVRAINLGHRYGQMVQFHLSEDQGDVQMSLDWYGERPIEFLVSLLKRGEVAALNHLFLSDCIWVNERELTLIQEYGMQVVLNPRMNQRIKAGEANLPAMLAYGICPYLGTDGEASNDDLSVVGERNFLQARWSGELSEGALRQVGRKPFPYKNGWIGEIAVGHYGDLKVLKDGVVSEVFVGGRQVLADGKLVTMDVEREIELPLRRAIARLE